MTIQELSNLIKKPGKKFTEFQLIHRIEDITKVDLKRAISGYIQMRQEGLVNDCLELWTVGSIDYILSNQTMLDLIYRFDMKLTQFDGRIRPAKPSLYPPDEIIPGTKMTRREISAWISKSLRTENF